MILKELNFDDAVKLSKQLKIFSYFASPFYLYYNCLLEEKGGETLVYEKQKIDNKYPLFCLPKSDNFDNQIVATGFDEDIKHIEKTHTILNKKVIGYEYFYSTDDWIDLKGSSFKSIRKEINHFQKEHNFKILDKYPKKKIIEFINNWAEEKRKKEAKQLTKSLFEQELKESIENIKILETYGHKAIFLEEDGKLLSFSIFIHLFDNCWVALTQKTIHGLQGLPQFLHHLKSKVMGPGQIFATGAEAQDPNLKAFKESLRPCNVKPIYVIKIGNKK